MGNHLHSISSSHWRSCSRLFSIHPAKWNDASSDQNSIADWTPLFFQKLFFFWVKSIVLTFWLPLHFCLPLNIFLYLIVEANVQFSFTFLIWVSEVRVTVSSVGLFSFCSLFFISFICLVGGLGQLIFL